MNIFALSDDPREAAIWQHDQHVNKMLSETAQMLSTNVLCVPEWCNALPDDVIRRLMRPAYVSHPCTKWARKTLGNFKWLLEHGYHLAKEFDYRFCGSHKSYLRVVGPLLQNISALEGDNSVTPFALAMDDVYKNPSNPVQSYRDYYIGEKISGDRVKWTVRRPDLPDWLFEHALFV